MSFMWRNKIKDMTQNRKDSVRIIIITGIIAFALFAIPVISRWENTNRIEVWVEYEVKILTPDKVVFYKAHNVQDSMVFKLNSDIFKGTEAIHKLEYRLP